MGIQYHNTIHILIMLQTIIHMSPLTVLITIIIRRAAALSEYTVLPIRWLWAVHLNTSELRLTLYRHLLQAAAQSTNSSLRISHQQATCGHHKPSPYNHRQKARDTGYRNQAAPSLQHQDIRLSFMCQSLLITVNAAAHLLNLTLWESLWLIVDVVAQLEMTMLCLWLVALTLK